MANQINHIERTKTWVRVTRFPEDMQRTILEALDLQITQLAGGTDEEKGRIVTEVHDWLQQNTGEDWSRMGTLAQLQSYGIGLQRGFRTWGDR